MSREKLRQARKNIGMTQQQMADYLRITLRYYKKIERGECLGAIDLWDMLEDLFKVHQRVLREIHHDKVDNQ